jgi:hypothetical protein
MQIKRPKVPKSFMAIQSFIQSPTTNDPAKKYNPSAAKITPRTNLTLRFTSFIDRTLLLEMSSVKPRHSNHKTVPASASAKPEACQKLAGG